MGSRDIVIAISHMQKYIERKNNIHTNLRTFSFSLLSPDGNLLASVGGDPDFMLTVWDWRQEKTQLRSKAFSQDVFRVTFSTELQGQLTSSGTGHIR